ncbi:MAG: nitrite reductase small subunit NirD [Nevskiales bacterium]|nr:nitrite reductase small subunit NirD [Nevskiales bacterium]
MSKDWLPVCALADIVPNAGVCALVDDEQIAVFRLLTADGREDGVYALGNHDPKSRANVLSRGLVGDLKGERVVASPVYKQHYSLLTGRCLEDPDLRVPVYPARAFDGRVLVARRKLWPHCRPKPKLVVVGPDPAVHRVMEAVQAAAPERYEVTALNRDPALRIDRARRAVITRGGAPVDYDRLVLVAGSESATDRLDPGTLRALRLALESWGLALTLPAIPPEAAGFPELGLARAAGLPCGLGVRVNDLMQTNDPRIYAIGACAEHRGLRREDADTLAAQARTVAAALADESAPAYRAPVPVRRLELSGLKLVCIGDVAEGSGREALNFRDSRQALYRRLILENARLVGALLLGETHPTEWYRDLIAQGTDVSARRHRLVFGPEFVEQAA